MEYEYVQVKKRSEDAYEPYEGDPGIQLYSSATMILHPFVPTMVPTGITMTFPEGLYGRFATGEDLAFRGVKVMSDLVQMYYPRTADIGVVLMFMISDPTATVTIAKGDRIAQLIVQPYCANLKLEKPNWYTEF